MQCRYRGAGGRVVAHSGRAGTGLAVRKPIHLFTGSSTLLSRRFAVRGWLASAGDPGAIVLARQR